MLKVGVQSAGWYDHSKALESFEYIKNCGFEAVDFNIDHYLSPGKLSKEGLQPTFFDQPVEDILEFFRPLKEASEKTGVEIGQMHAPFPCWYPEKDDVNAYLAMAFDKCFAVCEFVGCPAIVVHPVGAPSKFTEWDYNLELYRGLIPYITKYKGVKICLENIFTSRPNRLIAGRFDVAEDAVKMIDLLNEEAGGDYFGFCLDIGHANLTRRNIRDFINILGHRLTILHIHDNNGLTDMHHAPGKGKINWKQFAEALGEVQYTGTFNFEADTFYNEYNKKDIYNKAVLQAACNMLYAIGRSLADIAEGKYQAE